MKTINEFARKPELVKIVLDGPEIKEEFGDEVVFWMKDFVDINTYFDFYKSQNENSSELNFILQKIILNENGEPVLKDDDALPVTLAVSALTKINDTLGKLKTKPLMKQDGIQQN